MTYTQIPSTMKAFSVGNEKGSGRVREVPVPQLNDNEVLIKVEYAAQNPTDWKHEAFFSPPGALIGCDYSGIVVKLGSNLARELNVGDRVAGWVHGGLFPDKGAYAEYAKQESDLVFKVPNGLSPKEASHFGVAWTTACQAIVQSQKHDFPPNGSGNGQWYLIYGASSSVGLFAIQVAKSLGYRVIAVSSPHSWDLVKSYGADEVVDYHNVEEAKQQIQRISNGGVSIGLDTISEGSSFEIAIGGFKKGEKGRLNAILGIPKAARELNPDVEIVWTLGYTLFGHGFQSPFTNSWLPANKEDRAFLAELYDRTPAIITELGIKPNPIHDQGGLDRVRDGLEEQRAGKISGKKITYTFVQSSSICERI